MSGGFRDGAGRPPKWGEKSVKISIPDSYKHDFPPVLEDLIVNQKISKDEIIRRMKYGGTSIKKYDHSVSAGAGHTSSGGGDSFNNGYEEIDLFSMLVRKPEKTILITVEGESMTGIGIYPGDLLLVETIDPVNERPNIGDIVIVSVDDERMVKRYRVEKNEVILFSENPDHAPIRESERSIYVTGIVKKSIRMNLSKSW
jgi:DNA polymerase V